MAPQGLAVSQLVQFIHVLMSEGVAGWREHREFINAWNAGLDWFMNFTEGERLNDAFNAYVEYLIKSDYEGLPRPDGYEDDSDTFIEENSWITKLRNDHPSTWKLAVQAVQKRMYYEAEGTAGSHALLITRAEEATYVEALTSISGSTSPGLQQALHERLVKEATKNRLESA